MIKYNKVNLYTHRVVNKSYKENCPNLYKTHLKIKIK